MLKDILEKEYEAKFEPHALVEGYISRLESLKKMKWLTDKQIANVLDIYVLHNDVLEVMFYTINDKDDVVSHSMVVKNKTKNSTSKIQEYMDSILYKQGWVVGDNKTSYLTLRVVNILSERLETVISGLENQLGLEKMQYDNIQFYGKMHKHLTEEELPTGYLREVLESTLSKVTTKHKNNSDFLAVIIDTENILVSIGIAVGKLTEKHNANYELYIDIKGIENNAPATHLLITLEIEKFVNKLPTNIIDYIV